MDRILQIFQTSKRIEDTLFSKVISTDFSLVSELIRDADSIVNFAAETHVDRSISAPEAFLQSNVIGVFTILEALRKVNPSARMVHISTDEVYGDILEGAFKESDALRPSSPYSASKARFRRLRAWICENLWPQRLDNQVH